jgi:transcriptional regulator with XRE-family HTH domain
MADSSEGTSNPRGRQRRRERYRPIDPLQPLSWQFSDQRKAMSLTNAEIAKRTGLAPNTVKSALRVGASPMTPNLALRIGAILRLDPAHMGLVLMRDHADQEARNIREKKTRILRGTALARETLQNQGLRLESCLRWQKQQVFWGRGTGRRLALRALRMALREPVGPIPRAIAKRMLLFERGKARPSDEEIDQWLTLLGMTREELHAKAQCLKQIHPLGEAIEWTTWDRKRTDPSLKVKIPDGTGYQLRFGRTPTVYGPLEVELIEATQPPGREPMRVDDAKHPGIELAVLLAGRALFTLKDASGAILHRQEYTPGPHAAVCFQSDLRHSVTFLEPFNLVLSVMVTSNLFLGRHLR